MTPSEKAKELVDKYAKAVDPNHRNDLPKKATKATAKQCALIGVDVVIDLADRVSDISDNYFKNIDGNYTPALTELEFWQQVKEEINKLP
jgi:hypothetical protein